MRKIRYSPTIKAVVILLQELFAVLMTVCIILVTTLLDRNMLDLRDIRNTDFMKSEYYADIFEETMRELLEYQQYKLQFETDGVFDPEIEIEIGDFPDGMTGNRFSNRYDTEKEVSFRYYLTDLEQWSRNYSTTLCNFEDRLYIGQDGGLYQTQTFLMNDGTVQEEQKSVEGMYDLERSLQEIIVTNAEYYYGGNYNLQDYMSSFSHSASTTITFSENETTTEDETVTESEESSGTGAPVTEDLQTMPEVEGDLEEIAQKVRDGRLFELNQQELKLLLIGLDLENVIATSEMVAVVEAYLTPDGLSIREAYLAGMISREEMGQYYQDLIYTLDTIGERITAYKRLANRYGQEESNIKFWLYEESRNQYMTNITNREKGADLLNYGKELGSYFYYNKNNVRLNTNVNGMEDVFFDEMDKSADNSVIFVGIDCSFPYEDALFQEKTEYEILQPWALSGLIAIVISVFGWLFTFVFLGFLAGRRPEDDEIHLNWFDRIKTEFLLAGSGIFMLVILYGLRLVMDYCDTSDMINLMLLLGGYVFVVMAVVLFLYLSYVRRAKAGTLWSGSVLCWFIRGMRKLVANWHPSLRILAAFLVHTVILLCLFFLAKRTSWFGMVLLSFLVLTAWEAILFLREGNQKNILLKGIRKIAEGDLEYKIDIEPLRGDNRKMGEAINTIGEGLFRAVDAGMKNERLKADLITNVSHDIKTPLTSIINYVDLLKRENLDNERAQNYIQVLDTKSQRLKQLTEDLVEASKISSGNITLQMNRLNLVELVNQIGGEFLEKFQARGLKDVTNLPKEPVVILADGRRIWRVLENLYNNAEKYAMENTRVYVDLQVQEQKAVFSIKNISGQPLNIDASQLTERFIRGDVSRSTEGSGLGLSIAQNLTKLMGGIFEIYLDGDLFKVTISFPLVENMEKSEL